LTRSRACSAYRIRRPSIERAAREANPTAYDFPRALRGEGYNFSFSGLKTAVLRAVQPPHEGKRLPKGESLHADQLRPDVKVADVAAELPGGGGGVAGGEDGPRGRRARPSRGLDRGWGERERGAPAGDDSGQPDPGAGSAAQAVRRQCRDDRVGGYFRYLHGYRDDLAMDVRPMWPLIAMSKITTGA